MFQRLSQRFGDLKLRGRKHAIVLVIPPQQHARMIRIMPEPAKLGGEAGDVVVAESGHGVVNWFVSRFTMNAKTLHPLSLREREQVLLPPWRLGVLAFKSFITCFPNGPPWPSPSSACFTCQ